MGKVADVAVMPPPVKLTDPDQVPGVRVVSVIASRPQSVELASGVVGLETDRVTVPRVRVKVQLPVSMTLPGRIATADAVWVPAFQPDRVMTRLVC